MEEGYTSMVKKTPLENKSVPPSLPHYFSLYPTVHPLPPHPLELSLFLTAAPPPPPTIPLPAAAAGAYCTPPPSRVSEPRYQQRTMELLRWRWRTPTHPPVASASSLSLFPRPVGSVWRRRSRFGFYYPLRYALRLVGFFHYLIIIIKNSNKFSFFIFSPK